MIEWLRPEWADRAAWVSVSQLNPFFMAGWVGMLITGLNMMPVSQLDGGHTIYALFGRDAYKLARAFMIVAIAYVVLNLEQAAIWTPMLVLVIIMGIHHPPTADDNVELDDFRWMLGVASMAIPVLVLPAGRVEAVAARPKAEGCDDDRLGFWADRGGPTPWCKACTFCTAQCTRAA